MTRRNTNNLIGPRPGHHLAGPLIITLILLLGCGTIVYQASQAVDGIVSTLVEVIRR